MATVTQIAVREIRPNDIIVFDAEDVYEDLELSDFIADADWAEVVEITELDHTMNIDAVTLNRGRYFLYGAHYSTTLFRLDEE